MTNPSLGLGAFIVNIFISQQFIIVINFGLDGLADYPLGTKENLKNNDTGNI